MKPKWRLNKMRILTDYELNLVSGGLTSSSSDIIITGYYLDYDSADSSWYSYEIGSGGGGGGGDPQQVEEPNDTPCVETTFNLATNVTTHDANRAALAASNTIAALDDETYEYSSIVWALNGTVGYTEPYSQGLTDEVNWVGGLDRVPDGAIIIGVVHNHPDDPVVNDTIPSGSGREDGQDWSAYDQMVNYNGWPRSITVDSNMLVYIYSNEDSKTHVYDNTDKNQTSTSCSLQ